MRPALAANQSRDTIATDVVLPDGPTRMRNPLLPPHYDESCADAARKVASQEAFQPSDKDVPGIADALVAQVRPAAEGSLAAHMAMLSHVYDSMESASSMLSGDWRVSSETIPDSAAGGSGPAVVSPGAHPASEIKRGGHNAPGGVVNQLQLRPVPSELHPITFGAGGELRPSAKGVDDANRGGAVAVECFPSPPSAASLTISTSPGSLHRPGFPPSFAPQRLTINDAGHGAGRNTDGLVGNRVLHRLAPDRPPGIPAAAARPSNDNYTSTPITPRWGPWWRVSDAAVPSASAGRPSTESSVAPSWDARSSSSSESLSRYYMRD
ncbi:hypothetical protein HK405_005965 [Cladochytrium tenue]|nr:hypothetical protein HK405_005965 [Cladochytrium tenue]